MQKAVRACKPERSYRLAMQQFGQGWKQRVLPNWGVNGNHLLVRKCSLYQNNVKCFFLSQDGRSWIYWHYWWLGILSGYRSLGPNFNLSTTFQEHSRTFSRQRDTRALMHGDLKCQIAHCVLSSLERCVACGEMRRWAVTPGCWVRGVSWYVTVSLPSDLGENMAGLQLCKTLTWRKEA